jgi:uncharacterized YccA/Bax inhibitor family protein
MQSTNPVFTRSEGFNGRSATTTYPGAGAYTDPSTWQVSTSGTASTPTYAGPTERMSIDSVVQKTFFTLAVLIVSAAATWLLTGDPTQTGPDGEAAARNLMVAWLGGAFAGLALGLVISFRRSISPGLVLAYAVVEGIFLGAASKYFELLWPGIVVSAVVGTLAAFAGTLAAYKIFDISVSPKFRKFVVIASFGFVALVLFDFILGFFGAAVGFNGFGTLGLVMSAVGLALGVFMLILDFDFIEQGVAAGLPERESWRAAFGLTVTLVWIYIQLLRILAILRGE